LEEEEKEGARLLPARSMEHTTMKRGGKREVKKIVVLSGGGKYKRAYGQKEKRTNFSVWGRKKKERLTVFLERRERKYAVPFGGKGHYEIFSCRR